jgi:hypothetical protein
MILSLMIGVPIPLISVFLLKSTVDYLGKDVDEKDEKLQRDEAEETSGFSDMRRDSEEKTMEPGIHISDPNIIGTDPSTGGFKYGS